MKLSKSLFVMLTVLVVTAMLAACTGNNAPPTPTPTVTLRSDYKLGLVTNEQGTINDGTFNELAYKGARRASRDFGLTLNYRESIEAKDYNTYIEALISEGHNIIITVGFQMADATVAAIKKYPEVTFIGVDFTFEEAYPNFVGIQFREDQGGFLAGAMAGLMTKSNVVGVVAGVEIPPVQRFVAGFINGAKYVNPNVTALSVFTTSFADAEQGYAEADKMIAQKADVIFGAGGLTGSSAIVHAAGKGVFVIGVDQDEFNTTFATGTNSDKILTSAVKGVDAGVYTAVKNLIEGKFEPGEIVLTAANCGIAYAPFHKSEGSVPAEVSTRLEAIWRALAGETLDTGVGEGAVVPESLAPGALPTIKDGAPRLADCAQN